MDPIYVCTVSHELFYKLEVPVVDGNFDVFTELVSFSSKIGFCGILSTIAYMEKEIVAEPAVALELEEMDSGLRKC